MPISLNDENRKASAFCEKEKKGDKQNICMHSVHFNIVKKNLAGPAKIKDKQKDSRDRRFPVSFQQLESNAASRGMHFRDSNHPATVLRLGRRRRFHTRPATMSIAKHTSPPRDGQRRIFVIFFFRFFFSIKD